MHQSVYSHDTPRDTVLRRDIPWETTKLITGTGLQLLRRYDKKAESYKAQLLDDDGPGYVRVFVTILRDIFKEETVEYVLALIDEMLAANPKRTRLFHGESLADEDTYEPFLRQYSSTHFKLLFRFSECCKGEYMSMSLKDVKYALHNSVPTLTAEPEFSGGFLDIVLTFKLVYLLIKSKSCFLIFMSK